jgi:NADH dehydrogenase
MTEVHEVQRQHGLLPGTRRRPRVVIVGGGFGGLSAAKALRRAEVEVMLLDKNGYNTFQPLLYQVATGGLNPGDVTYALRAFAGRYRNVRFQRRKVTGIDFDSKRVRVEDGEPFGYDYLVLCPGVAANYFGVPGAEENSMVMYSRSGAIQVRDHVMASVEAAAQHRPEAPEPVVVIVGAGATGVEMAGALAELRNVAIPLSYPELTVDRVRVVLVEMSPHVLGPFAEPLREYTAAALRKRGVELRLNTAVREVGPDYVVIGDGEKIPSAVTVWATGVSAGPVVAGWGLPTGRGGRILIEPDLQVQGHPGVFAVGDAAVDSNSPLPQLAPPAMQGGVHAAKQIQRLIAGEPTEPFHYNDRGTMATIGRSDAVVQLPFGLKLKGLVAWLAWVFLHVMELIGNRNRFATIANLSVHYLSWPRALNVIVGDVPAQGDSRGSNPS